MTMATTFRRAATIVARQMAAPARVYTGASLRALSYNDGDAPWSGGGGGGGGGGGRVGGGGEGRRPGGYQPRQGQERRPGDWDCAECGNHVFASRSACPRCQAEKPHMEGGSSDQGGGGGYMGRGGGGGGGYMGRGGGGGGGYMGRGGGGGRGEGGYMGRGGGGGGGAGEYQRQPIEQRAGDWNCPSCDFHNFASRHQCFRCQESKPHDVKTVGADEGGWRGGRNESSS